MALSIYVDGPAHLFLGAANCDATQYVAYGSNNAELGITESGVSFSVNTMTHRVNSDDCGGSEGNPAEFLIMGAQGTVRGTMVKYNPDSWETLVTGLNGITEGQVQLPGTALFANNYGFSLWVVGVNRTLYFPKCELASTPREYNISTTERKTSFTITALPIMSNNNALALYYVGAGDNGATYPGCVAVNAPKTVVGS